MMRWPGGKSRGRLRRWWQNHFPLTFPGLCVVALALAALYLVGYQRMDLVVFALTVCALVIALFSLGLTTVSGLILRHRFRTVSMEGPLRLEAGYPNATGFSRPSLAWLPLVSLRWTVVFPDELRTRIRPSPAGDRLEEEILPLRRCRSHQVTRLFTTSDVLGLSRFSWHQQYPADLTVLPAVGRLGKLPLLRSLSAEDGIPDPSGEPLGDRMEIRPYVAGDPVRHIMWGVYARTRNLNVRLEERSVFHSRRTLAYLISGPADEAAAAVARVAVESGALGDDWQFGADGSNGITRQVDEALEMIAMSRPLRGFHHHDLERFLDNVDSRSAHCIVFAPAASGGWVKVLRRATARRTGAFSVVLATDGFSSERVPAITERLLFRTPEAQSDNVDSAVTGTAALRQLLVELGQLTANTVVVDRRTGQRFDQAMKKV